MAVVKSKPTSPGQRHKIKVVGQDLYKGKPYAPLLEKNSKSGGRNNNGRITVRHIGGGHKQRASLFLAWELMKVNSHFYCSMRRMESQRLQLLVLEY